jgi:16S rRNA (cytosine967-C5)-methyltransferase
MAHSSRPGSSLRSKSATGGTRSKSATGGTRSKSATGGTRSKSATGGTRSKSATGGKKRSSAADKFKKNAGLKSDVPERTPLKSKVQPVHSYEPKRPSRATYDVDAPTSRGGERKSGISEARPGRSGFRAPNGAEQPVRSERARTSKPSLSRPEPNPNYANPFRHEERAERGAMAPLHRPVAHGIVAALGVIMIEGRYADKVIERAFKAEKNMGGRDRKAFAEMVYEIVRWWRRYGYAIGWNTEAPPRPLEVGDIWKWLAAFLIEKSVRLGQPPKLPPWDEFKSIDPLEVANRLSDLDPVRERAIVESIPNWLDKLGEFELGAKWPSVLHALNQQAPVVLRANTLKCTREQLIARLREDNGISSQAAFKTDNGIMLAERKNVFTTDAFKDGWFEVQDGASQQVSTILGAQPGDRVIDACAGAGGKTLAIGAMMKNKGRLLSLDVEERKLQELRRRVARAGVDTSEAKLIDSLKVIKRLEKSADKVLLDVPCTGLGVLRRNPDKKWKFAMEDLERLRVIQAEILDDYTLMAKVGGTVVYATCSCLPSENRGQIDAFLRRNKARIEKDPGFAKFELLSDRTFWPGEDSYDGFYTAVLRRLT